MAKTFHVEKPETLTRAELEEAYLVVVEYCRALQDRQEQLCDAFRMLKSKYLSVKESNTDLLWNRLVRPDEHDLFNMPPMNDTITESATRIGQYTIGARLGVGSYAVVKECVDNRTHEVFALKIIEKSKITRYQTLKRLHNEILLTTEIHHRNVATLVDAIHTTTKLYLVLEHGGTDLFSYVSQSSVRGADFTQLVPEEAKNLAQQLVAGLSVLAERGIVHHDIKPENILVDDTIPEEGQEQVLGRLRITDFGMAQAYEKNTRCSAFCGSPGFFSPEMVTKKKYDPFKIDTWAVGCVLLEVLLGRKWFTNSWLPLSSMTNNKEEFAKAVANAVGTLPKLLKDAHAADLATDFCLQALSLDPQLRPAIEGLAKHPWIFVPGSSPVDTTPKPTQYHTSSPTTTPQQELPPPQGSSLPSLSGGRSDSPSTDSPSASAPKTLLFRKKLPRADNDRTSPASPHRPSDETHRTSGETHTRPTHRTIMSTSASSGLHGGGGGGGEEEEEGGGGGGGAQSSRLHKQSPAL